MALETSPFIRWQDDNKNQIKIKDEYNFSFTCRKEWHCSANDKLSDNEFAREHCVHWRIINSKCKQLNVLVHRRYRAPKNPLETETGAYANGFIIRLTDMKPRHVCDRVAKIVMWTFQCTPTHCNYYLI